MTRVRKTKVCSKCKIEKSVAEFHKNKNRPSGVQSQCKPCRIEYERERTKNHTKVRPPKNKQCTTCGEVKPIGEFYKHTRSRDGHTWRCGQCNLADARDWRLRHPAYYKKYAKRMADYNKGRGRHCYLMRTYGISVEEYEALKEKQDGRCALCQRKRKRLAVDHCHKTGRVRGLLCGPCNRALGMLGDNEASILKVLTYVQQ